MRIRDEEVFRLGAVDRVAEAPAAERLVVAAMTALRMLTGEARQTLSARRDCADEHALADAIPRDSRAELLDDTHGLVAEDEARTNRILTAKDVNIRAADRRQGEANDCLARAGERFRNVFETEVARAVKDGGTHRGRGSAGEELFE